MMPSLTMYVHSEIAPETIHSHRRGLTRKVPGVAGMGPNDAAICH